MSNVTYCGRCLRNLGTASTNQASFNLLAAHTPTCPKNVQVDGGKNIPSTVLMDNPLAPIWSMINALF